MTTTTASGDAVLTASGVDWAQIWSRVARPRASTLPRSPCLSPELCQKGNLCGPCRAAEMNAEQAEEDKRALWFAKQRLFPLLEMVRKLVKVYEPELVVACRPLVYGIMAGWVDRFRPELLRLLEEAVAKRVPAAASEAAAAIVAPGEVGRALRAKLTDALLPEIEDYLIEVALGCLDAKTEAPPSAPAFVGNDEADDCPSEGEQACPI